MKTVLKRLAFEPGFRWYAICQFLSMVVAVTLFRFRVFGRENVPADGPVLVASNHQSFFDPVLTGLSLPRQQTIIARAGLFKIPVFRNLIRSLGAFPVKRGAFDREVIRTALECFRLGKLVLVFPEGTRTRTGKLNPVKPGIGFLAKRGKVPVVPALINGAYQAWPARKKWFGIFQPIRVAFGPPINPTGLVRGELEAEIARSWDEMEAKLGAMAP